MGFRTRALIQQGATFDSFISFISLVSFIRREFGFSTACSGADAPSHAGLEPEAADIDVRMIANVLGG
ncbi:MAG: hypothetical protein B7Y08_11800 [Rhodospirillales bacterium 24-66-33]|jgi:hypothetical protein|nr:MAG: hypothetical protein B7Y57_08915 [Rhodospirillales bacterium 35-66-84]OYZ94550.1 MAG: hypothetical protein B7Y08_11800 [Rhodospirillales bacterium 24-66-33]OZB25554.1 MAG: hypothetical protein B7X63_11795 [Rhodospirillales bacterium 39-66-50]